MFVRCFQFRAKPARHLTAGTSQRISSDLLQGRDHMKAQKNRVAFFSSTGGNDATTFFKFGDKSLVGNAVPEAMAALSEADAVCFDVDSTVITEEGIDVLADFLNKGEEVAALTASAMSGDTKFEDALEARLSLLQPSQQNVQACLKQHPLELSPGIEELIEALHLARVDVYLVSGGFRLMIEPLAKLLCVAKTNIIANTILFDEKDGSYAGFDSSEPTSADMGKAKALTELQKEHGYETMVMVGDGATDAQAKPPAKAFIGYGGVIARPAVQAKACWYVTDFDDMTDIINNFHKNHVKK